MTKRQAEQRLPFVSIVIPARNEAEHLPRVFDALDRLDYPRERREVILVDNGSTDASAAIATARGAHVIAAPGVNVGEVRNAGARAARGELLAFVDADCLVFEHWLQKAAALLQDPQVGAVGGSCLAPADANWVERAWVVEHPVRSQEAESLATSSFILRRTTFEELGGFDANLGAGEDDDLSRRVRAVGLRLCLAVECAVIHLGYPQTLAGVARRQMWHGRSQLHAGGFAPMVLLTHAFAVCALAMLPYALLRLNPPLALVAIGAMAVLSSLPAYAKERQLAVFSVVRFTQRVIVYGFFFLGRSVGLLLNYSDMLLRTRTAAPMGEGER